MRKYILLLMAALFLVGCVTYKDGEPVKNEAYEKRQEDKEKKEEKKEDEAEKSEQRTITDNELEMWNNDDKPYFMNDEFFRHIDDVDLDKHFKHVNVQVNKVTIGSLSDDQLYDYTNDTGTKMQEIIEANYDIKDIPVDFYIEDELISRQNEHGMWVNNRMSNWKD